MIRRGLFSILVDPLVNCSKEMDNGKFLKRLENNNMQLTHKILMHKEPEGFHTVSEPALPGCITFGETVEHAIQMAKEAIELYIEELNEHGEEIPDDSGTLEYSLNVQTA